MPPHAHTSSTPHHGAPIAVLVVDDQAAVREGVSRLLACGSVAVRSVASAATGHEGLRLAAASPPDVVVLDVDLAGEDGIALIPEFRRYGEVLVLTSHGDATTRARAAQLGAQGFVEKHEPAATLLASIARVGHLHSRGDTPPIPAGATSPNDAGASSAAPRAPRS